MAILGALCQEEDAGRIITYSDLIVVRWPFPIMNLSSNEINVRLALPSPTTSIRGFAELGGLSVMIGIERELSWLFSWEVYYSNGYID